MRANGVTDFPDPQPNGGFEIPNGANPGSPAFQSAQAKCQKILSAGGGLPRPGPEDGPRFGDPDEAAQDRGLHAPARGLAVP